MRAAEPRVLLLSMPWTALSEPSLGLGILKAQLAREGITCRVRHLNLFLLDYLKASTYFGIGETFAINDFVFTHALQPEIAPEQRHALEERVDELLANEARIWLGHDDRDRLLELLLKVRDEAVPRYLEDCLARVVSDRPTLVGFTCLFDQTIPSVALAKKVREALPEALLALGGYALEGPVGRQVLESFPWIDAVVYGEGEHVIGRLARASCGSRAMLSDVPGVLYRNQPLHVRILTGPFPPSRSDLNTSPTPDYDDYRADVEELEREHRVTIRWDTVPIESSRGCWWGQTKHCIFCGIDDDTMRYRFKDPEVVLQSMATLEARHALRQFRFSDYILPHAYFRSLLPRLARLNPPYTLSCEMKANMTLDKFTLMRAAGFVEVQPGIESFSTPVLRRMDKGVTAIQNVYTLLLGYRLDIEVHYNLLFGFPTDTPEDYREMLRTIPLLYHLTPPISRNNVVTTRFAPMQTTPERFGITAPLRHDHRYEVIFSKHFAEEHGFDYANYCYYFERPYEISAELQELHALLLWQIQYWKDIHRQRDVRLSCTAVDDSLVFLDSRYESEPEQLRFGAAHARVYAQCTDAITPIGSIEAACAPALGADRVARALDELMEARVVFREGNRVVGLGIPAEVYERTAAKDKSAKWVSPYV